MEKDNLFDFEVEDFTTESAKPEDGKGEAPDTDIFSEATEAPSSKPSDAASIPIPKGTEISVDAYNAALAALKKSFSEGVSIIEMLENVKINNNNDIESLQNQYTEAAISEAIFESYINGPYYEAVDNPDKKEIKKVVNAIVKVAPKDNVDKYRLSVFRSPIQDAIEGGKKELIGGAIITALVSGIGFALTRNVQLGKALLRIGAAFTAGKTVGGAVGSVLGGQASKVIIKKLQKDGTFKSKLWQMVGVFNTVGDPLDTIIKHYTEKFKEQLGEKYILNAIKLKIECEKEAGDVYLLMVDTNKTNIKPIDLKITSSDFK